MKDTVTGKIYSFRFSIRLLFILFNSFFSFLLAFIYSILFPSFEFFSFLSASLVLFLPFTRPFTPNKLHTQFNINEDSNGACFASTFRNVNAL